MKRVCVWSALLSRLQDGRGMCRTVGVCGEHWGMGIGEVASCSDSIALLSPLPPSSVQSVLRVGQHAWLLTLCCCVV
jgi:hypothetical protein